MGGPAPLRTADPAAFLKGPGRWFPVTSEGRLVGILTRRDALAALEDLR